jgi:hypothetical protein
VQGVSTHVAALTDEQVVAGHLLPGERIHWVGKPDPGKLFGPADKFLVPFSLVWAGFAFLWMGGVVTAIVRGEEGLWFFALFGVPFVLVGLYMVFGRFVYKRWRRKRTTYAVTDTRVLSIVAGRGTQIVSQAFLSSLPAVSSTISSDGSGTIVFGTESTGLASARAGLDLFPGASGDAIAFFDIPDARHVADLVSRLREREKDEAES